YVLEQTHLIVDLRKTASIYCRRTQQAGWFIVGAASARCRAIILAPGRGASYIRTAAATATATAGRSSASIAGRLRVRFREFRKAGIRDRRWNLVCKSRIARRICFRSLRKPLCDCLALIFVGPFGKGDEGSKRSLVGAHQVANHLYQSRASIGKLTHHLPGIGQESGDFSRSHFRALSGELSIR